MTNQLAIVIPYFKQAFFEELLKSLINQTNQKFTVYIGDDASPENPAELIERFSYKLNIVYRRFEENVGQHDPSRHWNRCATMVRGESWICFMPDDDLVSHNAVDAFYEVLRLPESGLSNVIRFNVGIVDFDGKVISDPTPGSWVETPAKFYSAYLQNHRGPLTLGENIFRRESFFSTDGFINFPSAWCSDHATLISVAKKSHIFTTDKATFYFRRSGRNISSQRHDVGAKMAARVAFHQWIDSNLDTSDERKHLTLMRNLYWRAEHFVIYEWDWSLDAFSGLYEIQNSTFGSYDVIGLMKVLLKKILFELKNRSNKRRQ